MISFQRKDRQRATIVDELAASHDAHLAFGEAEPFINNPDPIASALAALERLAHGHAERRLSASLDLPMSGYAHPGDRGKLGAWTAGDVLSSPAVAAVLRREGVDPRALALGCAVAGSTQTRLLAGDVAIGARLSLGLPAGVCAPTIASSVELGEEGAWDPEFGIVTTSHLLPHTVLAAAAGRRLREVVTHPAIDPWSFVIETAFDADGTTTIHLLDVPMVRAVRDI